MTGPTGTTQAAGIKGAILAIFFSPTDDIDDDDDLLLSVVDLELIELTALPVCFCFF